SIKIADDKGIKADDKLGRILSADYDLQPAILHDKTTAGGAIIGQDIEPPVKIRNGLSAIDTTNLTPGQIIVWVL
ncbi:MAG: hypothetical protein ACW99U_22015, partial [Candidatus Thorarchaeota archaeon]